LQDAPDWIDKLLSPVNTFFDAVYNAVNGTLTFGENVTAQSKVVEFRTLGTYTSDAWTDIKVQKTIPGRVQGVLLMQIVKDSSYHEPMTSGVSIDWLEIGGEVVIKFVTGLENSTLYKLSVLII